METGIFSKFNLYDQLGYLMVGAIAAILVIANAVYFYSGSVPAMTVETLVVWLVLAYFLGHFVQGISNLFTDLPFIGRLFREPKHAFTEAEKKILTEARRFFSMGKSDDNRVWNLCYMYASAKDVTGQVQAFNAYYSLYRGWSVIFFLESLFLLYRLCLSPNTANLIFLGVSFSIALILHRRRNRFWNYLRSKVFDTYVLLSQTRVRSSRGRW